MSKITSKNIWNIIYDQLTEKLGRKPTNVKVQQELLNYYFSLTKS